MPSLTIRTSVFTIASSSVASEMKLVWTGASFQTSSSNLPSVVGALSTSRQTAVLVFSDAFLGSGAHASSTRAAGLPLWIAMMYSATCLRHGSKKFFSPPSVYFAPASAPVIRSVSG